MSEGSTDETSDAVDARSRTHDAVVDALRRYGSDAARLSHAFAAQHGLQAVDVQALVAIMSAERAGRPLTPGLLRSHLGLSSGGTSLVIDRLERVGHVRRERDHPADNRIVHLRHTVSGRSTGVAFFGPLGESARGLLDSLGDDELAAVQRFTEGMARVVHEQLDRWGGAGPRA